MNSGNRLPLNLISKSNININANAMITTHECDFSWGIEESHLTVSIKVLEHQRSEEIEVGSDLLRNESKFEKT